MGESYTALIGLGANLGNPKAAFARAVEGLEAGNVRVVAKSGLWQSPAWPPGSGAPDYVNAVCKVETVADASSLLGLLHTLESEAGRTRGERNAPRTLDLDLLDHSTGPLASDSLTVPHPRLQDRTFVLLPLAEVDTVWRHPVAGLDVWDTLGRLHSAGVFATHRIGSW